MAITALNRYVTIRKHATQRTAAGYRDEDWGADHDGTIGAGGNAHILDQTSEDIGQDRGLIFPETSAQRVMRNRISGQVAISGDIQVPVYSVGTPTMIYYALGDIDTTADKDIDGGTTANKIGDQLHVIKPTLDSVAMPYFQMGVGKDLKLHRYVGCVVRTMTIDFDPSETVLATFGILVRREIDEDDITTSTFPSNLDYNVRDRAMGGTELVTTVKDVSDNNNVLDIAVESLSIEVDNGFIDDQYAIGDQHLPNAYAQNLAVNGSMEIGYSEHGHYKAVLDEAAWNVVMKGKFLQSVTSGSAAAQKSSRRQIKFELPEIALKTANLPTEGTDRYLLNVDYEAERKAGSDDLIIFSCLNTEEETQLTR